MQKTLKVSAGLLALLAFATLFAPLMRDRGLAIGFDTYLHVGNVVECAYLLGERFPPFDWVPDVAGGRGGPHYIYYGSVGFLGPAVLVRLGFDPVDAIRLSTAVLFVVGFLSAGLWCSRFSGWLGGLAGGLLYVYGPYFYCLPYVRGAYAEHFAYALYPLVFHFGQSFHVEKRRASLLWFAITLSLVVGAHTLSLLVVVPFLVLYVLTTGKLTAGKLGAWRCLFMLGLAAVLLSASLFGPVFETGKVDVKQQLSSAAAQVSYGGGGVPFHSYFNKNSLGDIVSRCFPGRVHLLSLLVTLVIAATIRGTATRKVTFLHLSLAIIALLLSEESVGGLCVKVFPPMAYLQFPWRFLGIFNLFAAAAFAGCFSKESAISDRGRCLLALVTSALCLVIYLPDLPAMKAMNFTTRTREAIRSSLTTLDHENKYMPAGAKLFDKPAPRVLLEIPDGELFETKSGLNDYSYRVNSRTQQRTRFHQYWFEGWRAEIDGRPASIERDGEGLCVLDVSPGVRDIRLRFARTPLHQFALALSALGWFSVLGFFAADATRRRLGRSTCEGGNLLAPPNPPAG